MSILSEDQLRQKWDAFAPHFQKAIEPYTMVTAHSLLTEIGIQSVQTQSVLDVGCGAGGGLALANFLRGPNTTLYALDLSPEMLRLASHRIGNPKNVVLKEGSAEAMPFDDETFDSLYCNYVVHLVPNPKQAIKEARRVLKKGGCAAWSVWGRKENSLKFTILANKRSELMEKWGMQSTSNRSAFHLNDIEAFKNMVHEAGFSKCIAWYQGEASGFKSGKEYFDNCLNGMPELQQFFGNLKEDQQKEFAQEITSEADKHLEAGRPIQVEALIVVAIA